MERTRARVWALVAILAGLASVAISYPPPDAGVTQVGRTPSGALGATALWGTYESVDGGFTWERIGNERVHLERQAWQDKEARNLEGAYFIVDSPHVIRVEETSRAEKVVYSFEHIQNSGNRWLQALDKRDINSRAIATEVRDLFFDDQSGNLVLAMGLQGVVVVASDGTTTRVSVGRYIPTEFSLRNKVSTFFSALLHWRTVVFTGIAFLLALSFSALAVSSSKSLKEARPSFTVAAVISAVIALFLGVYPHVPEFPQQPVRGIADEIILVLLGLGLLVPVVVIFGLAQASRIQVLTFLISTGVMLLLIGLGALVLFQTGPAIANFVAVGLVGMAAFVLWLHQSRALT